jgi:hypothetical protein
VTGRYAELAGYSGSDTHRDFPGENTFLRRNNVTLNGIGHIIWRLDTDTLPFHPKEGKAMTLCPVAIAVGCKKCPVFSVCPAKSIIGDQAKKDDSKTKPPGAKK